MNLAQAVMLYAYELSKLNYPLPEKTPPDSNSLKALKEKVSVILKETGFYPKSNIYPRFLERLMFLSDDDIHLFHSFCKKLLKKKK